MKKGQRYKIRNLKPSGAQIIEGDATLLRLIDKSTNLWRVHFDGDDPGETFARFVKPEDRISNKEDKS